MRMTSAAERAITVSLPYFGCRPYLRRAVESILAQSHRDLTLIVLNDGEQPGPWDLLADIKDRRLIRFDLDANRGRYFADAVALSATSDRYFMVQDADDWSELDRAALLYEVLRENNAGAAFSAIVSYSTGRPRKVSCPACTLAPPPQLTPIAYHFGLYRTQSLRAIGGYHGGFRLGYDTLIPSLLSLTCRLGYVDVPLYHHDRREGSLSTSPDTGMTSQARREVLTRLEALYEQAYAGFCEYVAGRCSLDKLRRLTAAAVGADVTAEDARALAVQSARLRAQLAARTTNGRDRPRPIATANTAAKGPGGAKLTRLGGTDRPDVSVVMPTRYDTQALPRTMESFLTTRSLGTRLEFVIVDDASPLGVDGAALDRLFALQKQNASITVVQPGKHVGITRARNLGARYARADWLFITDAHVEVAPGWDATVRECARAGRVLAATIVSDETGGRGFGASLELPSLTIRWNLEPAGDLAPVQVASSAGTVIDRVLYSSLGGFDPGMIFYGPHEAEFSLRAWLRGAEVLNLPGLQVRHQFRSAEERDRTLRANLHLALHNRLRFALLYLPSDLVLTMVRDMTTDYPGQAVAQASELVASSDVWTRRSMLRRKEIFSFDWYSRKFGLEVPSGQPAAVGG
jgi:glycosyltransferase involved in cell wall biosynthesis